VPDTNADTVRVLAGRGVLDTVTGERVASAVGFRPVLVHQYVDVDDGVVIEMLENLGDFDAFVAGISGWLVAQRRDM